MTKAKPRPGEAGTGAVIAGSGQADGAAGPVAPARGAVVPAQLACRVGARPRAGERDAWPAVVAIALGSFALVFSELIPVGLLADISGHLRVSIGTGGLMVAAQSWMAQAMPANLEGGLALFVSALQGSLAAGSAVGGVIYDAKGPGGALMLAASVAAAGSLILLGRAGASISAPSAGCAEPAREPGRAAPAPSPGTAGGAGNTAPRPG